MNFQQIVLVIISGLGIFHGFFFAVLLWTHKRFSNYPGLLLGILMIFLSLRIGKSVVLEYAKNLELIYIYAGLCLLMLIGPLFYFYCKAIAQHKSKFSPKDYIHFLPAICFFLLGVFVRNQSIANISVISALIFFFIIYSHLLIYLLVSKFKIINLLQNNHQYKKVREWLSILFYGLTLIWITYVLNLFEDKVPYIVGPILYSLILYVITYLAILNKYLHAVSSLKNQFVGKDNEDIELLFSHIEHVIKEKNIFLNPDISLGMLSKIVKASPQKISFTINNKLGYNFNEFINRQRINQSLEIMKDPKSNLLTIAAISVDSGFNSLSSFNTAFKKFVGKTPSDYRNNLNRRYYSE